MSWRTEYRTRIAAAVDCWPTELSAMVVDYVQAAIRWRNRQTAINVSPDGKTATVVDDEGTNSYFDDNRYCYQQIIADRPLRDTPKTWTVQLISRSEEFNFRVGLRSESEPVSVRPAVAELRSPVIENFFDNSVETVIETAGQMPHRPSFPVADRVRYSLTADIQTGRFIGRIWTTDEPTVVYDWFSVDADTDVLADSVPVVYLFGAGSAVVLIDES